MFKTLKRLFGFTPEPEAAVAPAPEVPQFGMQGLPLHINADPRGKDAILRHLMRVRTLRSALPRSVASGNKQRSADISNEIAKRIAALRILDVEVPTDYKAMDSLIEKVKANG